MYWTLESASKLEDAPWPTDAVRPLLRVVDMRPPYDGAKDYFYIADVDDRDYVSLLVRETCKVLPEPKPKRHR